MPRKIKRLRVTVTPAYYAPDFLEMRVDVEADDEVHSYTRAVDHGDFESLFDEYMKRAKYEIKYLLDSR